MRWETAWQRGGDVEQNCDQSKQLMQSAEMQVLPCGLGATTLGWEIAVLPACVHYARRNTGGRTSKRMADECRVAMQQNAKEGKAKKNEE